MTRLVCIILGHTWSGDICIACGADKWVLNTGYPRPNVSRETSTLPSQLGTTERNTMTTFFIQAATEFLSAVDHGELSHDWDSDQIDALRGELKVARTTPVTTIDRAERGRLSVEIFGMNDDVETLAADVIADILHWVNQHGGEQGPGAAHFRAARYYGEERS